jgi:hypothetical protein
MNESEPNPSTHAELSDQIDALRRQTFILLLALIIVSSTLTGFLYLQQRHTGQDLEAIRPQATQIIQGYKQNFPLIQSFIDGIGVYGATHPDFQPILKKYGISNAVPVAPVAPKK